MHFCRRGIIRRYDLIVFLNFGMLLVTIKVSSRFFVLRASTFLWRFLWRLSFHNLSAAPCFICSFSSRVLRWRGGNNKTGINNATLIELQTFTFHETMKFHKKFVVNTRDTLSDGHSIRNNAEETYAAIADKELAINQAKYQDSFNPKRKKDKTSIFKRQYF